MYKELELLVRNFENNINKYDDYVVKGQRLIKFIDCYNGAYDELTFYLSNRINKAINARLFSECNMLLNA